MTMLQSYQEDAGEEDLQTDADEDDAAQNGCLAGQLGAELFADVQTGHAEDEGDCGDDDRCRQRHRPVVLRDGEADAATTLGVGNLAFLPYAPMLWLSIVFSIIFAVTGIATAKAKED